jgi:2-hydroxy-3-keto-5-methylthiopentenyl-1-phosphate phosphatase
VGWLSERRTELHIFSDFDGTITETDTLVFLAEHVGGGAQMVSAIGRLIREGKISLRDGIAAEMRSIRIPFRDAIQLLSEKVRIDATFLPFSQWCVEQQLQLTVLSAGFHEIIDHFLGPHSLSHVEVLANRLQPDEQSGWRCQFRDTSEFGHDKARALLAARKRGERICFIGDGLSDRASADVADQVFAKHGLADYCRERGIPFAEFESFDDVRKTLSEQVAHR